MIIIPFRTDAPVYHWPVSTVGLIVVNVYVYLAAAAGALDGNVLEDLILQFGDGLHPLQWVTSHFIHGGFLHLAGNMIFLWVFGLVIEGKVGWWKFLGIYLGIGSLHGALLQLLFLGVAGGGAYGASGILFGLLAMAMIWAPENEVEVFYWFLRAGYTEIRIRTLCAIYLAIEAGFAALHHFAGFAVGSSLLHLLIGAGVGLVPGILLVKAGLVDCEGWDIFSLREKRMARRSKRTAAAPEGTGEVPGALLDEPPELETGRGPPPAPAATPAERRADALVLLRDHLRSGDAVAAKVVYDDTVKDTGPWPLPGPDLLALIDALRRGQLWLQALPLLQDCLERFPEKSASVRLLLGKVLIEKARRPASGLEVLEAIPPGRLGAPQEELRKQLIEKANQLREQGVLELDVE
ncbi:MAG: rhomboid family intramembrane serine protease [Thermoanaerobaculia bacterium]